jgi:phenylacetate-CoA ligase
MFDGPELPAAQLQRLQEIWADCTTDIPYYAKLVSSGRAPKQIRDWQDLRAIPVLTRQQLQDEANLFTRYSRAPDDYVKTAGSTGTPLRLGVYEGERDLMRVVKLAAWQQFGYTLNSRLFLIWGHSHLLGTGWKGRFNHLKRKTADAFLGYRRVDAYRLNPTLCERYARMLIRWHPLGIVGYAAALDLFARQTAAFRSRFHKLGVRFVLATSEPGPRQDSYALLEDHFNCPVVQEYGGAEFGQVGFKIGGEPFSVFSDLNYVECDAETTDGPSQEALLVTSLYPRYLPLIRYRVGDAVENPLVLPHGHIRFFTSVTGRINDVVRLDDGDCIHSVSIMHCIHQESSVHNIQVVLHDDRIEICLISHEADKVALEARIRRRLSQVHPALAQARFKYVEDLQTNRAGKRRWFVDERTRPLPSV